MGIWTIRLGKLLWLARSRDYWRTFASHRVVPSTELSGFPFRSDLRTVIDVGANRGQFSAMIRRLIPNVRVIAFEPVPAAAHAFRQLHPDVELHEVAAGAADEAGVIRVGPDDDQSSIVGHVAGGWPQSIQIRQLDGVLPQLDRPLLLKLDVQGYEPEVLAGAVATLAMADQVLVEVAFGEGERGHDVIASLVTAGFRIEAFSAIDVRHGDVLFSREH